jgi:titin
VWTDIAGESGYRVERSADGASGWTTAASLPENATSTTDTGLAATTTYYYRVIATTKGGDASVSDVISTTTLLDPPAAPTLIAVPVSSTGIDLSWTDVGTESGYRIEVSLDGGATWDQAGTQGADVTTFNDTGLAPATTYWYRVIAFNAAGDSAPSEPVSTTTDPAPTTPSDPPSVAPAA